MGEFERAVNAGGVDTQTNMIPSNSRLIGQIAAAKQQ
jgi:hypothetical protein